MDPTKHKAAQSETPAPQKGAATTWHTFKRSSAAIAIVAVASLIPCVAILQNGMSNPVRGKPDDVSPSDSKIWGQLEYTPIVIAPPLEFVQDMPISFHSQDIAWHFLQRGPAELSNLFQTIDLSAPLRKKLVTMARPNESTGGMSIYPSRQFVLDLSPKDRSALYIAFYSNYLNIEQSNQFQFHGSSPDEWFAGSAVPPATRKLIEPLIYRHGEFMYFADIFCIEYPHLQTERANLLQTLMRHPTFLAHLKVSPDSDLEALVKYWGRGDRAHEVRPILEALMQRGGEQAINITHLLPALARRKLYTYPGNSGLNRADRRRDCHWTSMNFFNEVPDDEFCEDKNVNRALMTDYYRIGGNLRLGDVIVLFTQQMKPVHSAVYIADDVFFHRCGSRSFEPWALTRRKHLESYYPSHQKFKIHYYRPNSL